jgi:putative NADH-flavin reductase
MTNKELKLAALGCTGHVTEIFVDCFLKQGIKVCLLARNPEAISVRYRGAGVIKGTMMSTTDTARVMKDADAAFRVPRWVSAMIRQ